MRISAKNQAAADAPVTVTAAARETLVLRAFVRQAVPMLRNPEAFSAFQRQQLAMTLERAVNGCAGTPDTEQALPQGDGSVRPSGEYEPGMDWP
jgi:hypothetical protein